MVSSLVLGAFKVVHRVMKKTVLTFNATVRIVESGDANRLFARVLRLFTTDHVYLSAHLDRVIESVN